MVSHRRKVGGDLLHARQHEAGPYDLNTVVAGRPGDARRCPVGAFATRTVLLRFLRQIEPSWIENHRLVALNPFQRFFGRQFRS